MEDLPEALTSPQKRVGMENGGRQEKEEETCTVDLCGPLLVKGLGLVKHPLDKITDREDGTLEM